MNIKFNFVLIFSVVCLLIFHQAMFAQIKPKAIQFDNISESDADDIQVLTAKLNRFVEKLAAEPETTRGYIDVPANTLIGKKIKLLIAKNIALENRILFWGNLRHPENSPFFSWGIYIYLIPQDAEIPYSSINEPILCPALSISTITDATKQNSFVIFTAKTAGGEKDDVITYNWKISAGSIIEGQETPTIKVDAQGAKEITATVEIGGIADECPKQEASMTFKIQ